MFIGRKKELKELNRLYKQDKFQFAVIYGRRRIGKTYLINEFVKGKKIIYFTGIESNSRQNLQNFSHAIVEGVSSNLTGIEFSSFQMALTTVFEQSLQEQIILVIDEYPYVARAEKSLASTIQLLIDRYKENSKLFLILCGSSMSYMEDKVLAYKAPLYGRRTAQFKIMPFTYVEAFEYMQGFSNEDKAFMYGIAGGTPQYLLQMDVKLSVEENIKNTFLNQASMLYEEPINLLKQEVREPAVYTAVISAIASGASRLSDISNKIGENTSVCANYIKSLVDLGIVKKETPYGEKSNKKTIYLLEDNMFKFWYRFILPNMSLLSMGATDMVYKRIEKYLPEYMGSIFEDMCRQYMWQLLLKGETECMFVSLGRWWGNDPVEKKQTEIDIIGFSDDNSAVFGECKWTNEPVDVKVLETLRHRASLFHHEKKYLYLFAKNGFTEKCREQAEHMGNVKLISYESDICMIN